MSNRVWHRGKAHDTGPGMAICEGPCVIARVVGGGYPIGVGYSPTSEQAARWIVEAPEMARLLALLIEPASEAFIMGSAVPVDATWEERRTVQNALAEVLNETRKLLARIEGKQP